MWKRYHQLNDKNKGTRTNSVDLLNRLENSAKLTSNRYTMFLPNNHSLHMSLNPMGMDIKQNLEQVAKDTNVPVQKIATKPLIFKNCIYDPNSYKLEGVESIPVALGLNTHYDIWIKPHTFPKDVLAKKQVIRLAQAQGALPIYPHNSKVHKPIDNPIRVNVDLLAKLAIGLFIHYVTSQVTVTSHFHKLFKRPSIKVTNLPSSILLELVATM